MEKLNHQYSIVLSIRDAIDNRQVV